MARPDVWEELDDLLDAERGALLAGDLGGLPAIVARKERLLDRLGAAAGTAENLDRLKARAIANQGLIAAALEGVRSARERLAVARAGGPPLSTYDVSGKASVHGATGGTISRRA